MLKNKMNYPFKKSASLLESAALIKGQEKQLPLLIYLVTGAVHPSPPTVLWKGNKMGLRASINSRFSKEKRT